VDHLLIIELALVYWLGALTAPMLGGWIKRILRLKPRPRRARGRRSGGWHGYFQG